MLELPQSWRMLLVSALDDYCETLDDTSDLDAVCEAILEQVESVSAEVAGVDGENIVSLLEDQLQNPGNMSEALSEYIMARKNFEWVGEEIALAFETLCELDYIESDDQHDDAGLFDSVDNFDEDDDDTSIADAF